MSTYSPSIEKLIESFEKLPSIGHKTAQRLAFYMLDLSDDEVKEFTDSIVNAKKNLKFCSKCFNIADTDPCYICADPKRDSSTICVVEDVRDVIAMERTHEFKGVYHVLHGSISPMNGVGPDDIKIKELLTRIMNESVKVAGDKTIKEIKLQKDVVDPDDVEMLQDLILTCVNEALRKVDSAQAAQLGKFNIPGLM